MGPGPAAGKVLYVIACAAPSARRVPELVRLAQTAGFTVCVVATPYGTRFLDLPLLEQLTGYAVRSDYKRPEEPDVLPRADALIAFPATFNTVNKWRLGISDTLAVGLLCEYTGLEAPILAVPSVTAGAGLGAHPAFQDSVARLREWGVDVLYDPDTYPPNNAVPCEVILDRLRALL
jgi:phosphopantothenoylcysteine synthetase/decarboxylase